MKDVKLRRVYTLKQAAEELGVTYVSLWRAAARGDLKVLKGFPRLAISAAELERFYSSDTEYSPKRRKAVSK
jgi:Helix-turn-helix domain